MENYVVTIVSINNAGKQSKTRLSFYTMKEVARFLLTFEPKRGYDPIDYRVTKEMVLDLE